MIISSILSTLEYMHSKKISHRDIKPENILYDHFTGSVKIIDFEISKMSKYEHQRLEMWTRTGTLQYKAPEMLEGGYNELVDIWAVGVLVYEMVMGKRPFVSEYNKELTRMILEDEPNYETLYVTQTCIDFIKRLLKKNPEERFSAQEALRTPFILKYSSVSSTSSPYIKQNGSEEDTR